MAGPQSQIIPQGDHLAGPEAFLHCGAPQHDLRFRTQPNFRIRPTRLAGPVRWKRIVGCYGIAHLNNEPVQKGGGPSWSPGRPWFPAKGARTMLPSRIRHPWPHAAAALRPARIDNVLLHYLLFPSRRPCSLAAMRTTRPHGSTTDRQAAAVAVGS